MNAADFNRHSFPSGGWQFIQQQTGWRTPTPVSTTFDQTCLLIRSHRSANPAIVAKHKLSLNIADIGTELEAYNRKRLNIPAAPPPPKAQLLSGSPSLVGAAAVGDRNSVAFGIKRAAQGSAVVYDWLSSGGKPVSQELADKRGEICVNCPQNIPGSWYTVAPAEVIREILSTRSDLKLATRFDDRLKSCNVCKCLNRLKIWCPMEHIQSHTKLEIMAEFPAFCWIARKDN